MKYRLLYLFFFVPFSLLAQSGLYNNTWLFGPGNAVNFSSGSITLGGIPSPTLNSLYNIANGPAKVSLAVSDASGDLQFFVQIKKTGGGGTATQDYTADGQKVFDKNGNPFPNGNLKTNFNIISNGHPGSPLAIPFPGRISQYLLFYVYNNGLFYSIIDMSLNGGLGDVDPNQKDIQVTGFGTINGLKMTAIQGCNGVWLIIRSRTANEYFSFKIDENGIDTTPVSSVLGELPLSDYTIYIGLLKASNNGKLLVAATNKGTELYDFEKCSGRLKNARLIDTFSSCGVCFSLDDSKLYISHNTNYFGHDQGEIYQYDLSQPDLQSITASKILVMRNPLYLTVGLAPVLDTGPFGDLKLGRDGKIYVGNNNTQEYPNAPCSILLPGPDHNGFPLLPTSGCVSYQYLHVIHDPNQAGFACNAELTYLELIGSGNNLTGLLLQNDILAAPTALPDTVSGNIFEVKVCYKDNEILSANENGSCYLWDDGSTEMERKVTQSGTYWVGYFQDCTYQTDTFFVQFIPLPEVNAQYFGCEDEIRFTVKAIDGFAYEYTLRNENHEIVGEVNGFGDAVFENLHSGNYFLEITSQSVCDTALPITLNAYPAAEVQAYPEVATIAYGDSIQLNASGADLYHWWPSGPLDSAVIANPWARPFEPTVFTVLGINRYGCRDSGFVNINIDYVMPDLIPNAFSPNGDGLNDVFRIEGVTYQKVVVFQVFNRYGQVVFSTTNPDVGWDGRFNGKDCEVGVYYYLVRLVYSDGRERIFKGDVQLIR